MEWYIIAGVLMGAVLAAWPAFTIGRRAERHKVCDLIRKRCPEVLNQLPEVRGRRRVADYLRKEG